MTAWIAMLVVGVGSIAFRLGPIVLLRARQVPTAVERGLHHAATAVLVSLAVLALRDRSTGAGHETADALAVAVSTAAAAVAVRRGGSFGTAVAAGIAALWLARAVLAVA